MSAVAMRQVGERIPGRIARVRQIRLEHATAAASSSTC
jgi:hypothetical protein